MRHWNILMFLKNKDGINTSMSTLRRYLESLLSLLILTETEKASSLLIWMHFCVKNPQNIILMLGQSIESRNLAICFPLTAKLAVHVNPNVTKCSCFFVCFARTITCLLPRPQSKSACVNTAGNCLEWNTAAVCLGNALPSTLMLL